MPDKLGILNLLPLPKSGALSKTENYQKNIIIMKTINRNDIKLSKTCHRSTLRCSKWLLPGRSTVAQVFALRRIIEGVSKNKLPAVLVFIDFKRGFDSINH